jgi:hypothetical protein
MANNITIVFSVDRELEDSIREFADKCNLPISALVRTAVSYYLDKMRNINVSVVECKPKENTN